MIWNLTQQELIQHIRTLSLKAMDTAQVANRLKELLPDRFELIKNRILKYNSIKLYLAEAQALNDAEYTQYRKEYLYMKDLANKTSFEYKICTMLFEARRSSYSRG